MVVFPQTFLVKVNPVGLRENVESQLIPRTQCMCMSVNASMRMCLEISVQVLLMIFLRIESLCALISSECKEGYCNEPNGVCSVNDAGEPSCYCHGGFTGDNCEGE